MAFLIDAIEYGRPVKRWNRNGFTAALSEALGLTIGEMEPGEYGLDRIDAGGGLVLLINRDHNGAPGRARLSVYPSGALTSRLQRGGDAPPFPKSITIDSGRPMAQIANAVRAKLIEPAAEPMAQLRHMIAKRESSVAALEAEMNKLRGAYPFLSISRRPEDETAHVYGTRNGGGLTAALYPDGRLSVKSCDFPMDRRADFLRVVLGDPPMVSGSECGEVASRLYQSMDGSQREQCLTMDGARAYVATVFPDEGQTLRDNISERLYLEATKRARYA